MEIDGTLKAIGEKTKPITFTRFEESTGSHWLGIYFSSSSQDSILDWVIIEKARSWEYGIHSVIKVNKKAISFKNSSLEYSSNFRGLYLINSSSTIENATFTNFNGPYHYSTGEYPSAIFIQGGNPLIKNSTFKGNTIGIEITGNSTAQIKDNTFEENDTPIFLSTPAYPTFSNNQAVNNDLNGILVGGGDIIDNTVWQSDLPYVIERGKAISATLTLEAGTIVKFKSGGYLEISGKLITEGTSNNPVLITSISDSPENGWQSLIFYSSGSLLDGVIIRYGGGYCQWGSCWGAITQSKDIEIEIKNSIIENNKWGIFSNEISCLAVYDKIKIDETVIFSNNQVNIRTLSLPINQDCYPL